MDTHTLEVLGFARVREILAGLCQTGMGREQALALMPSGDSARVTLELDRLAEMTALAEEPPLFEIRDLRGLLAQLRAEGLLNGAELLLVRQACAGLRRCHDYFHHNREKLGQVWSLTRAILPQSELERALDYALDEAGTVRDSATPELREIRTRLRQRRNRLVGRLERLAADNPGWFSGGATVRGDRFVLPMLLEHRGRVPGVVHSTSGSGQTLFVEPLDLVADGNEYQELRDAEAEEVARVLRTLSRQVAGHEAELAGAMAAAADLDSLVARARLAARLDCTRPEIADDGRVEVVRGRHPLLVHRKVSVVPLDFRLPDGAAIVLISGPNAGGKTVVLKTLGLFSLMLSSGMYLPTAKGTRLPVFGKVFADIGDEQSLDSDLSSFTAHLTRLREIVEQADSNSLVLVDEIGSSTAPEEGAALAIAVLETLRDRGVRAMATTHFGTLKMFVHDEPGMANAAMEFRGGPTYRLLMGIPGESSAFETAAATGLPASVIEKAKARVGREWLDLGAKLKSLDEELHRARVARQSAELEQRKAEILRQEYDAKTAELRRAAASRQERLRAEQERYLHEKRREIENLVRQIRERQADKQSVVEAKKEIEKELRAIASGPEPEPALPPGESRPDGPPVTFNVGDTVLSHTFSRQGTVVETADGQAVVAFGQIRMQLNASDLRLVKPGEVKREPEPVQEEQYVFEPRLNVRGMTRAEAEEAVGRFLGDAVVAGSRELAVLHGKGTGALRQSLWARLKRDSRVEQVKLAEANEGGGGVTVVTMKAQT